jgi:tetratricopeptide (TPR) repeat protein
MNILNPLFSGRTGFVVKERIMDLLGISGRRLLLLGLTCAIAPVSTVMAQANFAVIQIANSTDDVTITYQFSWGATSQQFTIGARQRSHHDYRYEPEHPNSYPIPKIQFSSAIDSDRKMQAYALRASASAQSDSGGPWYVFEKRVDAQGEKYIDLVSGKTFLTHNRELVESLIAQREYQQAINRCKFALGIAPNDALTINDRDRATAMRKTVVTETALDISQRPAELAVVPGELQPFISPEAYRALETFRLGSKVDAEENARLQVAYDRAYEEGRYVDAQEANFIRAIEREPVAALWKMLSAPAANTYYLPKFTPVEERLNGLKQPLVGAGSNRALYVKSDDDLAGLRIAVRRPPRDALDGGLETAAILAFRWIKGSGPVPLDPPDNLRVLIQLKKNGDHAMLGMSFSLSTAADGSWDLRPEIYTSPKFGEDRFHWASSTAVSPRGCMDCHALGFNTKANKFVAPATKDDSEFAAVLKRMPGVDGFLADARKRGATEQEIAQAESIISRPDLNVLTTRNLRFAVVKLWNAIYYANQPYLDDADGRFVEYHDRYGSAWFEAGDFEKALEHFNKAVGRRPDGGPLYLKRGWVNLRKQRFEDALRDLDQAIRLQPELMEAHNLRARLLATAPVQSIRNGTEAVQAATRACELAGWKSPEYLDTLAAAYAEAGDFREAVKYQEKALTDPGMARALGADETKAARERLELYRQNRPFRDAPSRPAR